MNTKTTLFLVVLLILVGALYLVLRSQPRLAETDMPPSPVASSQTTRDLLEEKLGDMVKVVCQRKGDEPWVFEKDTEDTDAGQGVWRMTSPRTMKCVRWEVESFGNRLGSLRYELSYKPGEPGAITAVDAGLDPPEATVMLADAEGKTVTVEIGRAASPRETYVRLAGSDEICVGKSRLTDLVKDKLLDYREKQVFNFEPKDAKRVEVVDRTDAAKPATYAFNRDGDRWMMASPVTAKATGKVDDMLQEMSRLRVIQWHDEGAGMLTAYGLEPAVLTVRVTVEEEIPVQKEEDETLAEPGPQGEEDQPEEEEPPAFETRITVRELHLSDQSPLGEDTRTYMRLGDEFAIATVMKTTADKFKPIMSEWREMRITTVDPNEATAIKLTTPVGSANLVKKDGAWFFEPDGGQAENPAVSSLLGAIGDLSAVAFIDDAPTDLASFGLDQPRAEIRLTIPGVEGVERIVVGNHTDEQTKRLTYVRRNDLTSIAKVRTPDVAKLLEGPQVYRDRTIVDILPSRFERITLSAEKQGLGNVGGPEPVTLERTGNDWSMIDPVEADVRDDQVDKLIESLGGLRAEQVVEEAGEPSAYGLHAPAATVTLTYEASSESGGEEDETEAATPDEAEPASRTLELAVTEHDGKHYAKRADRGTIYQVSGELSQQLQSEYRTDRVLDFPNDKVRRFSIRKGDRVDVFTRRDDRWVYEAEPDLPLDSKKVDNLHLQLRDLRTNRYIRHVPDDLATFGLSEPYQEVAITLEDGTNHVLWVSNKKRGEGVASGFCSAVQSQSGVFLLTDDSVRRFQVSLDELEKTP